VLKQGPGLSDKNNCRRMPTPYLLMHALNARGGGGRWTLGVSPRGNWTYESPHPFLHTTHLFLSLTLFLTHTHSLSLLHTHTLSHFYTHTLSLSLLHTHSLSHFLSHTLSHFLSHTFFHSLLLFFFNFQIISSAKKCGRQPLEREYNISLFIKRQKHL